MIFGKEMINLDIITKIDQVDLDQWIFLAIQSYLTDLFIDYNYQMLHHFNNSSQFFNNVGVLYRAENERHFNHHQLFLAK